MADGVLPRPELVEDLHSSSIRLTDGDLVEVFASPYPGPGRRSMGSFPNPTSEIELTLHLTAAAKTAGRWQIVAVIPSEMREQQPVPSTFGNVSNDEREDGEVRELSDVVVPPSDPLSLTRPSAEMTDEEILERGRRLWRPTAAERIVPRRRVRREEIWTQAEEANDDMNAVSDSEDEQAQLRWAMADSLKYARRGRDNPPSRASLESPQQDLHWQAERARPTSVLQRLGQLAASVDLFPTFPSRRVRVASNFQEVHDKIAAEKGMNEGKAVKQVKVARKTDMIFETSKRAAATDEETDDETEDESSEEERKRKLKSDSKRNDRNWRRKSPRGPQVARSLKTLS